MDISAVILLIVGSSIITFLLGAVYGVQATLDKIRRQNYPGEYYAAFYQSQVRKQGKHDD